MAAAAVVELEDVAFFVAYYFDDLPDESMDTIDDCVDVVWKSPLEWELVAHDDVFEVDLSI